MVLSVYSSFWQQILLKAMSMTLRMIMIHRIKTIAKKPKLFANCWQVIWRFMSSMPVSLYWVSIKTSWLFCPGRRYRLCQSLTSLIAKMPILMSGRRCWQDAICIFLPVLIRSLLSLQMKCAYGKTLRPCLPIQKCLNNSCNDGQKTGRSYTMRLISSLPIFY